MKNQLMRTASSLLTAWVVGCVSAYAAQRPVQPTSYVWSAELVAVDDAAKTATFKAPIMDHLELYVNRFRAGQNLMLLWDLVGSTRGERVRALWEPDPASTVKIEGYILPITFVSADGAARTVTFSMRLPAHAMSALESMSPGQRLEVTAPIDQPSREAAITTIRVAAPAPGTSAAADGFNTPS